MAISTSMDFRNTENWGNDWYDFWTKFIFKSWINFSSLAFQAVFSQSVRQLASDQMVRGGSAEALSQSESLDDRLISA